MPADAIADVKPAPAPQNTPDQALGRRGGGILPNQILRMNTTPITPISSRTTLSGTTEARTPASATPIAAPGSITFTFQPSQSWRYHQTEITSCIIRIGSRIASAWNGGIVSASSGVAAIPMPENPPLASPISSTAMKAVRRNSGLENTKPATSRGLAFDLEQGAARRNPQSRHGGIVAPPSQIPHGG